jgi:hypothetical protein
MLRTSLNNYILRVYRLDPKKPQSLVGLVEEVGVKEKKAFTNLQELWDILSHPKTNSLEKKRTGKGETETR